MDTIRLKGLVEEDFVNFKLPSMFLITSFCDFKCEKENNDTFCHNSSLAAAPIIEVKIDSLIDRYINNPITKSIVIGGLEPFLQLEEIYAFIKKLREKTSDLVVIYTGYDNDEIQDEVDKIIPLKNIIIKYGRYKSNNPGRYDEVLGIKLASDNQYACFYGGF